MFNSTPVHLSIIFDNAVFTTIIVRRGRDSSGNDITKTTLEEKVATSCAYFFSLAKPSTYSSKLAGGDYLLLLVIFSLRVLRLGQFSTLC